MTLHASINLKIGTLDLDVELDCGDEIVVILGPNGAGKSTLLRCLAGLLPIDSGEIIVDGEILDKPETGIFVAPEDRPIGMVFQDYLLFPFLSAEENVAFGLRAHKMRKRSAHEKAREWLERVGLSDEGALMPSALSGGQHQRVALVRALAINPRLLILDEPLAALDVSSRVEVRRELSEYLGAVSGTRLLVTHDLTDAHVLADRVVIIESGSILQQGTMADLVRNPRSSYVAELVGLNGPGTGAMADG